MNSMGTSPAGANPRDADRQALRTILADVQAGINERALDKILAHLGEDVVITYQNADVSRGKAEAGAYFNKNFIGGNAIIKRLTIRGEIAAPAVFVGDAAVAHGTSHDEMELTSGRKFKLDGKWSAAILNQQGKWRIACLHFSTNVLDNNVLAGVKKLAWMGAAASFVAGGLLVLLWSRLH
jgi:ketosteroid isomerase-like protein